MTEAGGVTHRIDITEPTDDRLDRYLADRLRLSRSRVASLIGEGRVSVNGDAVRKSYAPEVGDRIVVRVPPAPDRSVKAEDLPLDVVYEDQHLAVIDKAAGMVVHPAPGNRSGTLVNAALARFGRLSSIGGHTRPGVVHRLDKDTSGLLVMAVTDRAHTGLSEALARRAVRRGYLAAAWGHLDLEDDRLEIDRPIGRDRRNRKRMAVMSSGGRRAVTRLQRLERWISAELLAVRLHTGRTHQIRVHLKSLGHPVVCDPIYAPGWERGFVGAGGHWAEELGRRTGRLFLHAAHLAFDHPVTGERLSFTSALPPDLAAGAEWARRSSGGE